MERPAASKFLRMTNLIEAEAMHRFIRALTASCRVLLIAGMLGSMLAARNSATMPDAVEGQKLFAKQCSGCHGADGRGTEQGPALVGNAKVRASSVQVLREVIHSGIPAAGMPAFNLPNQDLVDIAAFVHSLNAPAADRTLAGDPEPGKQFFFGKGQCASCHMVDGRGSP